MNNGMMMALIQAARGGQDPMQVLTRMAGNNPQMQQALQMIQGKSPEQLRQIAQNMASQRGVNMNDILTQMGLGGPVQM